MSDQSIICEICGAKVHAIQKHLKEAHPTITIEDYQRDYPDAPLLSEKAKRALEEVRKKRTGAEESGVTVQMVGSSAVEVVSIGMIGKGHFHKIFELGEIKSAMNSRGNPIEITLLPKAGAYADMIPEIDPNYVYNIDLLKSVLMGLEMNIPIYLWGHAGVGKSTLFEQVCARTHRPYMRVQHTANTEEAHILGQTLANEQGTYFEPGPLALAMKYGWVYNADEYDFAPPSVVAVYQPVLEGKPLIIKEAPTEWRVIKPHKNFRFVATGNTNGSGDETGLYQGTVMGNAANYSRFGITEHVPYMTRDQEVLILVNQASIPKTDAERLVEFANKVREGFAAGNMTMTIGPRELIYAARLGACKLNYTQGLLMAFINRCAAADRESAMGIAQRIFGA
jgi:cobaltochelatase CobS